MRTLLVGMLAGFAALVGFAGAASADAIRLEWQATGTNLISVPGASSTLVLDVLLDVGPADTYCGGLTVDYQGLPKVTVVGFTSNPDGSCSSSPFTFNTLGVTTDTGTQVRNINGIQTTKSHADTTIRLGTITFHTQAASASVLLNTLFTATDSIRNVTSFGNAQIIIPEPGALLSLGSGLMLLGWLDRRRRRRASGRRAAPTSPVHNI